MEQRLYKYYQKIATEIIKKFPKIKHLTALDIVHECWDFNFEDVNKFKLLAYKYIRKDFHFFESNERLFDSVKTCPCCGVLPISYFEYRKNGEGRHSYLYLCKKCTYNKHKEMYRKKALLRKEKEREHYKALGIKKQYTEQEKQLNRERQKKFRERKKALAEMG